MSWRHLRDVTPKARKDKVCYLCRFNIKKGEIHTVRTGMDNQFIASNSMHTKCCSIADKSFDDWQWENHDPFEFREEYLIN